MNNKYIKITVLNNYLKAKFDQDQNLKKVYLKGEISNFKNHTRGHLYFTLKDDYSRISAVMFQSNAKSLTFLPEDGMNVLVEGRVSTYPAQGTYQIYVDKMETDGLGNLYIEFEKLKEKLKKEGLFNPEHKRPIPKYPQKIGIITASTGAAIRDILSTIKRRYPICETILFPSLVQGAAAASDIVRQINRANCYDLDVLIVGRGGGSIEDLWAFNEEIVARAIYESKIPIISAVGHEIDFTIADFVADLRAPTPTGAAEMAVPTLNEIKTLLNQYQIRLNKHINNKINTSEIKLKKLQDSYIIKNPLSLYELKEQQLDNYIDKLNQYITNRLRIAQDKLNNLKDNYILRNPLWMYEKPKNNLKNMQMQLNKYISSYLQKKQHEYDLIVNTLKLVNPLNILDKGYSLVYKDGKIIKNSKELKKNDLVEITMYEGKVISQIKEVL